MTLLIALLLAQPFPTSMTARQGHSLDGGFNAWAVECVSGCSGGGGVASIVGVNVLDAGAPVNINPPASLPLPAGAATGAKQDTGNTSLGSIDGKLPALSGGKIPVDIGASIVSVTGGLTDTQLRATPVPISGTVTASGALTDTQLRATAVPVSLASAPSTPVTGTFFQTTQPVDGIDGGALATDVTAALIAAELVNGTAAVKVLNLPPAPARNPLTGAAKVDGSGSIQPVSAAALPLPTGAAQENGGNLAAITAALTAQSASQTSAVQFVVITQAPPPLNPFLQRCNPVRRTNCQP